MQLIKLKFKTHAAMHDPHTSSLRHILCLQHPYKACIVLVQSLKAAYNTSKNPLRPETIPSWGYPFVYGLLCHCLVHFVSIFMGVKPKKE